MRRSVPATAITPPATSMSAGAASMRCEAASITFSLSARAHTIAAPPAWMVLRLA